MMVHKWEKADDRIRGAVIRQRSIDIYIYLIGQSRKRGGIK